MKLTPSQKEAAKWVRYHGLLWRNRRCWCGKKDRDEKIKESWKEVCYWSEVTNAEDSKVIREYLRKVIKTLRQQ